MHMIDQIMVNTETKMWHEITTKYNVMYILAILFARNV